MKEQNSRNIILDCALELFANKGYEAVSVSEIVEKAQITKPTLYYFFGSKEGLFEALLKDNFTVLDDLLADACHYEPHPYAYEQDVFPVLKKIANVFFRFARENTSFYLMILSLTFAPPSSRPAEIAEVSLKRHYLLIERVFHDISAAHSNLKGQERTCTWHFIAMINAHIAIWHRGYAKLDEGTENEIVTDFMHGIFS